MRSQGGKEQGCAFCAIVRGKDPDAEVVCEDATWVAFFPLDPATPGHTLVVPREHVADLWGASGIIAADLMKAVVRVGRAIQSALKPTGMNMITSAGEAAEQSVFHLHLHVVPRWTKDGFGRIWPLEGLKYEDAALENIAELIRDECQQQTEA